MSDLCRSPKAFALGYSIPPTGQLTAGNIIGQRNAGAKKERKKHVDIGFNLWL